jgi:hypothetical protein
MIIRGHWWPFGHAAIGFVDAFHCSNIKKLLDTEVA